MAPINALRCRILQSEGGRPSPWSSTHQSLHPEEGPAGEQWARGDGGQGLSLRTPPLARRSQITSLPPELTYLRLPHHPLCE